MARPQLTDNPAIYALQNVASGFRLPVFRACDLFLNSAAPREQVGFATLCREQLLLYVQDTVIKLRNNLRSLLRNAVSQLSDEINEVLDGRDGRTDGHDLSHFGSPAALPSKYSTRVSDITYRSTLL